MSDQQQTDIPENAAMTSEETSKRPVKDSNDHSDRLPNRVLLVPYPKFVFMYPTLIVSAIAAIVLQIFGLHSVNPDENTIAVVVTGIFFVVLMLNTFILVFDFPRATSLTLFAMTVSFVLGSWILIIAKPSLLPAIANLLTWVRPVANASFYLCITVGMMILYAAILIKVRFDYWELSNNELLHHHGFLSDLKRYPAPNLRVDKEINDVFEYMLLGAGRLILHPTTEKRAIVLDNILHVSGKEKQLTRMLGAIKVQINTDNSKV
ncbi:hypothetical protein N9M41_07850 [Rhodopirellula sp.]|nr:hypothetical protein [Rhodopirellula sp.]